MCEFYQNEDTFSVYLINWNIVSPKMVRNNILERYTVQEKSPEVCLMRGGRTTITETTTRAAILLIFTNTA